MRIDVYRDSMGLSLIADTIIWTGQQTAWNNPGRNVCVSVSWKSIVPKKRDWQDIRWGNGGGESGSNSRVRRQELSARRIVSFQSF